MKYMDVEEHQRWCPDAGEVGHPAEEDSLEECPAVPLRTRGYPAEEPPELDDEVDEELDYSILLEDW